MSPLLAASETAAVTVVGIIIGMVTVVTLVAQLKEGTAAALKMFAKMEMLVGLMLGGAGTYFFTKESNAQALARKDAEKAAVVAQVDALEAKLTEANNRLADSLGKSQTHPFKVPVNMGTLFDEPEENALKKP
jgi:hypothetical protein